MEIRLFNENDSIVELTEVIHKAYRQLADLGFNYWGTHQTIDDTKTRISSGECYICIDHSKILGTILLKYSKDKSPYPDYAQKNLATFHQFAVLPEYQKKGIGVSLLEFVEKQALDFGAEELACDTAEGAKHLIRFYQHNGYKKVANIDWTMTNYKSVILSKNLVKE